MVSFCVLENTILKKQVCACLWQFLHLVVKSWSYKLHLEGATLDELDLLYYIF